MPGGGYSAREMIAGKNIGWKSHNLLSFKTCGLSQEQTVVPGSSSKERTDHGYLRAVSE